MTGLVPPNWRPLPLLGPHALPQRALYRAAALSHASPDELAQCPEHLTWLDLRTRGELDQETRELIPAAWSHVHRPFMEVETRAGQAADTLDSLITGTATFGDHYCLMFDMATANIAGILRTIQQTEGPIVIACQGGRDRTGLIAAVALLVAQADSLVIIDDYVRTNDDLRENLGRQPGGAETQELFAKLDLTCSPRDMAQVIDHIAAGGGIRALLTAHLEDGEYDRITADLRRRFGLEPTPAALPAL